MARARLAAGCRRALNLRLARITGKAPMLTPPKLRELRHADWVVDNRTITRGHRLVARDRLDERPGRAAEIRHYLTALQSAIAL